MNIKKPSLSQIAHRLPYFIFGLPIALTELLQWSFLKLAGEDWYKAGFRLSTFFIGAGGLALYKKPIARRLLRFPARIAAWLFCLAGLAWFVFCRGFLAFFLVPYLRQGKRLRAAPLQKPEPEWVGRSLTFRIEPLDILSISLILLLGALLWVARSKIYPMAPDGYYHALVAREIVRTGNVPVWDWWEYAPLGRPHLYTPLLHILIALLSLPFNKDIIQGMQLFSVVLLPTVAFTTWYLARWLFDARRGFFAVLLLGIDQMFLLLGWYILPSIIANAVMPLVLVFFLSKRFWPAAVLLSFALYAHMGVATLGFVGLFLFAVWRREYFKFFLGMAAMAILLALPWYGHIWMHHEWLANPVRDILPPVIGRFMKLAMLLFLNLILALLVIRGWKMIPWFEKRYKLLLCQVVGFLPMLLEYGGRYFMHTVTVWVLFAGVPLVRFMNPPLRFRRVLLFLFLALCPVLLLQGMQANRPLTLTPMPSGWSLMPVIAFSDTEGLLGKQPDQLSPDEAREIGEYIKKVTAPGQVIHLLGDGNLGVVIAFHADRPIDTAAWPEVRNMQDIAQLNKWAESDPTGCYVAWDAAKLPADTEQTQIGRIFVGIRYPQPEVSEKTD